MIIYFVIIDSCLKFHKQIKVYCDSTGSLEYKSKFNRCLKPKLPRAYVVESYTNFLFSYAYLTPRLESHLIAQVLPFVAGLNVYFTELLTRLEQIIFTLKSKRINRRHNQTSKIHEFKQLLDTAIEYINELSRWNSSGTFFGK